MQRRYLAPWLLVGLAALTGCASSRSPVVARDVAPMQGSVAHLADVAPGSYVRLTLVGGEKVSGNVRELTDTTITLDRPRNYSFKERQIALAEMQKIKVLEAAGGNPVKMSWVAVSLTLVCTLVLAAISSIRIGE